MVFFLTVDRYDGIAVLINGRFIGSTDQKASASGCRIVQSPIFVGRLLDIPDTDQAGDNAGNLARRIELSFAFAGLLSKFHHKVFVSITDDIIAAGSVCAEINGRILEYTDQAGYLVHKLFAGAEFIRIVEAYIWEGTLKMVVLQKLL